MAQFYKENSRGAFCLCSCLTLDDNTILSRARRVNNPSGLVNGVTTVFLCENVIKEEICKREIPTNVEVRGGISAVLLRYRRRHFIC